MTTKEISRSNISRAEAHTKSFWARQFQKVENKEKKIFEKKKNKEKNIHKKNFSPKENINFLIQLQKEVNYKLNNDINSTREKELLLKLLEDTHKLNKFYENKE